MGPVAAKILNQKRKKKLLQVLIKVILKKRLAKKNKLSLAKEKEKEKVD